MRRASELECWDTEDLAVEFAAFRFEVLKFLDSDVCVMLECKVCDVSCAFSDAVLDEFIFSSSAPLEASPSSVAALVWEASESITANHYSFPFGPDVLADVELLQHLAFRGKHGSREAFTVHINAEYVPSVRCLPFLFIEERDDLSIRCGRT